MRLSSRCVIWELGFLPKRCPIFSSNTTASQVLKRSLVHILVWGWDYLSHVSSWSDMLDASMCKVCWGKEACSP